MSSAPPPPAFVALARQPSLKQLARQRSAVEMPPPPPPEKAKTSRPTTSIRKPTVPKLLNVSMTVGIAGEDVPAETFDRLSAYLEQNAKMVIMAFERGDAHLLLHIQGMFSMMATSTRKIKDNIRTAIDCLRWACMKPMSPYRVEKIWQACTAPESVNNTDVDHILYGRSDNDKYWNSMNPMELMLADARELQVHAGYNMKPPPLQDDDNDNGEHDVPDPDAETRPDLGTDQAADPIPTEVPVISEYSLN
ncbi:hypothetical protein R1sor_005698 [Riccia sorocarpa]|uniref:Uncharacterized protein n=1 Tax=Riccia sorocarpa TaxID=122646 RepID=A0ABD3HN96_9MARC